MSKFSVLLPISLAISLLSGNVFAACGNLDGDIKIAGLASQVSINHAVTVSYFTVENKTNDYCTVNSKENPRAYELLKTAYLTGQSVTMVQSNGWITNVRLGQKFY